VDRRIERFGPRLAREAPVLRAAAVADDDLGEREIERGVEGGRGEERRVDRPEGEGGTPRRDEDEERRGGDDPETDLPREVLLPVEIAASAREARADAAARRDRGGAERDLPPAARTDEIRGRRGLGSDGAPALRAGDLEPGGQSGSR